MKINLLRPSRHHLASDTTRYAAEREVKAGRIDKAIDLYVRDGNPQKAIEVHIAIAEILNKKGTSWRPCGSWKRA